MSEPEVEYLCHEIYGVRELREREPAFEDWPEKRAWVDRPWVRHPDGTVTRFESGWATEVEPKVQESIAEWKRKHEGKSKVAALVGEAVARIGGPDIISKQEDCPDGKVWTPLGCVTPERAAVIEKKAAEILNRGSDVEKKAIDWAKPVRTKGGQKVRVLCTDAGGDFPVVLLMDGQLVRMPLDGSTGLDKQFQIENIPPEPLVRWVSVFGIGPVFSFGYAWETEKEAKREGEKRIDYVATVRIEIPQGEKYGWTPGT